MQHSPAKGDNMSDAANTTSSTPFSGITTIEECMWYQLIEKGDGYYCYFYDRNGLLIQVEGPLAKLPKMRLMDNHIVYFSMQSGTGIGTQWGYFYDCEEGVFSDVYPCIFDYTDDLVAYADSNMVVVCDIFNSTDKLAKIVDFQNAFSDVAFPFVDAVLSETDSTIEITYLHGDDYQEITEVFCFTR